MMNDDSPTGCADKSVVHLFTIFITYFNNMIRKIFLFNILIFELMKNMVQNRTHVALGSV